MMTLKPKINITLNVKVFDKNGKMTQELEKPANSFVRGIIDLIAAKATGAEPLTPPAIYRTVTDITGVDHSMSAATRITDLSVMPGGGGYTNNGIHLGTGSAAVTIADYKLGGGIAPLQEGTLDVSAPVTVGSTRSFTIQRLFTNTLGASITVNEVGIYASHYIGYGYVQVFSACIERTLQTFSIADGASALITYTIGITV